MITTAGRYEPAPGARISLWPIKAITAVTVTDIAAKGKCSLLLYLGTIEVVLFDQDAASLEVLGHALIRLAEEQRRSLAKADLEPLQEK